MNKMAGLVDISNFHSSTRAVISRERAKRNIVETVESRITQRWRHAAELARRWSRSRSHYQEKLNVSTMEHMSTVDACDGGNLRQGKGVGVISGLEDDLLVVSPHIDGRLRDEGRN